MFRHMLSLPLFRRILTTDFKVGPTAFLVLMTALLALSVHAWNTVVDMSSGGFNSFRRYVVLCPSCPYWVEIEKEQMTWRCPRCNRRHLCITTYIDDPSPAIK